MALVPLSECCLLLGVDPKTLRLWLKTAHLSSCPHPADARLKCLTYDQLTQLAALHERRLPDSARAGRPPLHLCRQPRLLRLCPQARPPTCATNWRKQLPPSLTAKMKAFPSMVAPTPKNQQRSSQQASWLFVIDKAQLTTERQWQIEQCSQERSERAKDYLLSQNFSEILR